MAVVLAASVAYNVLLDARQLTLHVASLPLEKRSGSWRLRLKMARKRVGLLRDSAVEDVMKTAP